MEEFDASSQHETEFYDSCGYVVSFDVHDEESAVLFYEKYGFVVFRDVYSSKECEDTRCAMWDIVEEANEGLLRDEPSTWISYNQTGKYGLSSRGPCFHPQLVNNRQSPKLISILSKILDVPLNDVMVSHDRFTIYRATQLKPEEYGSLQIAPASNKISIKDNNEIAADADFPVSCTDTHTMVSTSHPGDALLTGRRNVHLDLNPWWWHEGNRDVLIGADAIKYDTPEDFVKENNLVINKMGPHVQCVMNFNNNHINDGGTLIVPCSHNYSKQWCINNKNMKKMRPFVTFNSENNINENNIENDLLNNAIRITMREGSVLMWHQTVFHGTQPNRSGTCRLAQFLKSFSKYNTFIKIENSKDDNAIPITDEDKQSNISTVLKIKSKSRIKKEQQRERRRLRELAATTTGVLSKHNVENGNEKNMSALTAHTSCIEGISNIEISPNKIEKDIIHNMNKVNKVDNCIFDAENRYKSWQYNGLSRLLRRSRCLQTELENTGAIDIVTPLGKSVFGLDIDDIQDTLISDNSLSSGYETDGCKVGHLQHDI